MDLIKRANELLQERAKLRKQNNDLLDSAEGREGGLTDEERQQFDKRWEDMAQLEADAKRYQQQAEAEKRAAQARERNEKEGLRPEPGDRRSDPTGPVEYRTKSEARPGVPSVERVYRSTGAEARPAYAEAFRGYLSRTEPWEDYNRRALQADSDEAGGYTVAPQQFVADLIKFLDDQVFIRPLARVMQVTNADSLGAPSLDADPADADWTSELATGNEDSTMDFGKRELRPHPLAKRIKVSKKLVRASALNIDQLVRERLGYKFAVTQEKAFLTGTGAGQPLGVFTASSSGISTSRDVSTDNTTTAMTADGLINAKYNLKGAYWPRGRWIFHRDGVKQIAKFKDGEGQYLWRESVRVGEPDRLLGIPVLMSEYAPNTFTTGQYVGIIGDFSHYWIAEALSFSVQLLMELYAETNQNGYIGRYEGDGAPVLEEAFTRVTLA